MILKKIYSTNMILTVDQYKDRHVSSTLHAMEKLSGKKMNLKHDTSLIRIGRWRCTHTPQSLDGDAI
jgi:hypothetical protein